MKCCEDVRGADCHCAQCHLTFTGLSLFDAHQDVDYDRQPPVICLAPDAIRQDAHGMPVPATAPTAVVWRRLVQDDRGTWTTPEGLKARDSHTTRLAMARERRTMGGQ